MGNAASGSMEEETSSFLTETMREIVTTLEMSRISRMIEWYDRRALAKELKVTEPKVQEIVTECVVKHLGGEEVIFQILKEWERVNGGKVSKTSLKEVLVSIGQKDVAKKVFPMLPEFIYREMKKRDHQVVQRRIEENQRRGCQRVELPQVFWSDRLLPLEELYTDLVLFRTVDDYEESKGEPMYLEELFDRVGGEKPVRILVESGPGYGKTALCLKLISDWGHSRSYIASKFKIIFLFELRYFKRQDSIEELFKSECEAIGVNGNDGINCVKAFENETLLILDEFDEMKDEHRKVFLPLLLKKKYPSMSVVVISRRGMFHVEEKEDELYTSFQKNKNMDSIIAWNKKILIKGVTVDQINPFWKTYLNKDYPEFESKINSISTKEINEIFHCPHFLILLPMLLEEKSFDKFCSKTVVYKEFFNFTLRRNLIRENRIPNEEEIDIRSQTSEYVGIQSLDQFGQLAIDSLRVNKLMFEEKDILRNCSDEFILHLGIFTKIPKIQGHTKKNFYRTIHKSLLEFAAAYAMWNMFKSDKDHFKRKLEQMGDKGLKPTNEPLFYVFLAGLMNSEAHVLFQSLILYSSWFNIESIYFTNMLLEIEDVDSFISSFEPIFDSFIPSPYVVGRNLEISNDFVKSKIHSVILKYISNRQLMNVLIWKSNICVTLFHELYLDCFHLILTKEVFKVSSIVRRNPIKCKNIICEFSRDFAREKWNDFVSLFSSIQSERISFKFDSCLNDIYFFVLLHSELIKGQWIHKNIDRLQFQLNEFDDTRYLAYFENLVKRKRINGGVFLRIKRSERRTESEISSLTKITEALFDRVVQSKTIKEFIFINEDYNFFPRFNIDQIQNSRLKSFYVSGSLNLFSSNEKKNEISSVEEIEIDLSCEDLNFIQNIHKTKYLCCTSFCFDALFNIKWSGLKEIEELSLTRIYPECDLLLKSISLFTNLQVMSMNVRFIMPVVSNLKLTFINLFSSLNLRICEFLFIQTLESLSFFTEVLMEGLNKKEKGENNSAIDLNERKINRLQELVIDFAEIEMDFSHLKQCIGIKWIQSMLRNKQLQQCCWVNYSNVMKLDQAKLLFPLNDRFRIFYEVVGMNPLSSRRSQFYYRWFSLCNRLCVKLFEE